MKKKLNIIKDLIKEYDKINDKEIEVMHLLTGIGNDSYGKNIYKGKEEKKRINKMYENVAKNIFNITYDLIETIKEKYNYDDEEAIKYLDNKLNKILSKEEI